MRVFQRITNLLQWKWNMYSKPTEEEVKNNPYVHMWNVGDLIRGGDYNLVASIPVWAYNDAVSKGYDEEHTNLLSYLIRVVEEMAKVCEMANKVIKERKYD